MHSQFCTHIRAVCGLEFIENKKISNAEMFNIIGDEIEKFRDKKFKKNEFFFDYLKTETRPGKNGTSNHFKRLIIELLF